MIKNQRFVKYFNFLMKKVFKFSINENCEKVFRFFMFSVI